MKLYDLLYKKSEDKNGKARWERVGVVIDKEGKMSIKLDMMAVSSDSSDSPRRKRLGWLVRDRKGRRKKARFKRWCGADYAPHPLTGSKVIIFIK